MSHYSHKHASTLPYSSRHMSCVSKRERGSLGWQKIRPCVWQTALTVMHIRCIDRCTSSHCPGSSVTEGRKRLWKEAWTEGGGSRCFRAPWGWLLTDRPDPAGPDGLGGGPQVPRRVPLVLRADSCSFPWGETERKGERVYGKSAASIHVSATYKSWQGSLLTGPDFWVQANKYTQSDEKENRPLFNFMVLSGHKSSTSKIWQSTIR